MAEENRQLLGNQTESEPEDEIKPHSPPPPYLDPRTGARDIQYKKLPTVIYILEKTGLLSFKPLLSHKSLILVLTFICYTSYHLSRKPFSVVKVVLCPQCANCSFSSDTGWAPFNQSSQHGNTLLGVVDYSWLFAYAISMFISGQIADRVNLRYFLFMGMTGSAISVALLGVAYFANIHALWYFIVVQVFGGIMQSTGWPGTVAVMSHWFGKHNRGLIMGIWNSHTSVGNILGTIIPSFWADCDGEPSPWGWSFIVPAAIMLAAGVLMFLMLVVDPRHVGLPPPRHTTNQPVESSPPPDPVAREVYGRLHPELDVDNEFDKKKRQQEQDLLSDDSGSIQVPVVRKSHLKPKSKPINILRAICIPGVIEYSLALFFDKLVSYTFLYWLPFYVKNKLTYLSGPESDWLSTLFDVGGIIGGIAAGLVSDLLQARAITCVTMLILAIPSLFFLEAYADEQFGFFIVMLILSGIFVNGPYSMITTAVSSDLGTHESLKNNQNAKATVTAIIDGTGSLGAAVGPLIVGWLTSEYDWMAAFYVLMGSCLISALFLSRLLYRDIKSIYLRCESRYRRAMQPTRRYGSTS
ncbi:glucose-6-phosphate exchanger SLC37A2-like isoform X2 [Halichondria panicea]|uniref:glucose-6-phosphate exchanger SLC37A2-like isoform X2 n=1 Tax=Halichondria panicea TaxID=6063 RepID=UPI00312B705C